MKPRIDLNKAAAAESFGALAIRAEREHENGSAAGKLFTPAQSRALSDLARSMVEVAREAGAEKGPVIVGGVSFELREKWSGRNSFHLHRQWLVTRSAPFQMPPLRVFPSLIVMAVCALFSPVLTAAPAAPRAATNANRSAIPYVPTRHDTVRDLLWLAEVGANDVVYDLGSGDGRIVIAAVRDFRARKGVGVEKDSKLIEESRTNALRACVSDRVEFVQGSLFTTDFSEATVVVLYLGYGANMELRPALLRMLKPGTRIVSHKFGMGEWAVDKKLSVRTPMHGMYSEAHNSFASNPQTPDYRIPFEQAGQSTLSVWIVPERVAGVWRSAVLTRAGQGELTVVLEQRLSGLSGLFRLTGPTNISGNLQVDLWGTHLRLHSVPTNTGYFGQPLFWMEGQATNDTITGSIWVKENQTNSEVRREWVARREPVDFAGTWTWDGPKGNAVELKIERKNGKFVTTYYDPRRDEDNRYRTSQPILVEDFYDFGGGFYFTHLLGREPSGGRRMGVEDGWLIGNATVVDGAAEGTIAFYSYPDDIFTRGLDAAPRDRTSVVNTGRSGWKPVKKRL